MIRLPSVELRRFFARRITRGAVVFAVCVVLFLVGVAVVHSHPARTVTRTVPGQLVNPDGSIQQVPNTVTSSTNDTRINLHQSLGHTLEGTGIALLLMSIVLGASFVGAEFNAGSLSTQLCYEPNRWRVHVAKAIAVAVGTALVTLGLLAFVAAAVTVGAELRGIVHGTDLAWWRTRVGESFRIAAAAGVGGAMAYSITVVARRSAAAITLFFVQLPLISTVSPEHGVLGFVSHFAPLRGLLAFVLPPNQGGSAADAAIRTPGAGAVLSLAWLVGLVVVCGLAFERAEIR